MNVIKRALPLLVLVPLLATVGCSDDGAAGSPDGGPDAGADGGSDAGVPVDGGTDGGVDGGNDGGTQPVRTLERTGIYGELPVENRFLDPGLSGESFAWYGIDLDQGGMAPLRRLARADLPAGRFALSLPHGLSGGTLALAGMAKGGAGPLHVEVWLGRTSADLFAELTVGLVGHDPTTGEDVTIDLTEEPDTAFEGETLQWRRWSADLPGGLFGWTALSITDPRPATLYLAGPLMVQGEAAPQTLAARALPARRAPTPAERRLMRVFRDHLGESLAAPARSSVVPPRPGEESTYGR